MVYYVCACSFRYYARLALYTDRQYDMLSCDYYKIEAGICASPSIVVFLANRELMVKLQRDLAICGDLGCLFRI